jgi:hypothetical protein
MLHASICWVQALSSAGHLLRLQALRATVPQGRSIFGVFACRTENLPGIRKQYQEHDFVGLRSRSLAGTIQTRPHCRDPANLAMEASMGGKEKLMCRTVSFSWLKLLCQVAVVSRRRKADFS